MATKRARWIAHRCRRDAGAPKTETQVWGLRLKSVPECMGEEMTTAEFAYSRLLGDRYGIEEKTKTWDKTVIDKSREIDEWAEVTKTLRKRVPVYTFVNNHFAGHAPAAIRELKIRLGMETAMAENPR